ncbi:MAG: hypothetical protein LQ346_007782 [Caloplaca aetnensis]|nr:MAG: hypothetical protein LQ346_007782 [Caloplaca aetnensis]
MARFPSPHVAGNQPEPEMHQHPANEASAASTQPAASSYIEDTATTSSDVSTDMGELTPSASRCSTPTQTDSETDMAVLTPTSTNRSSTPTQGMDIRLGYERARATSVRSPDGRCATTVFGGSVTAMDYSVNKTVDNSAVGQSWLFDKYGNLLVGPSSTNRTIGGGANQTFNFTSGSTSHRDDDIHAPEARSPTLILFFRFLNSAPPPRAPFQPNPPFRRHLHQLHPPQLLRLKPDARELHGELLQFFEIEYYGWGREQLRYQRVPDPWGNVQ